MSDKTMKLLHTSPCSMCGEPGVRKEYQLSGQDKFGYLKKVVEKCTRCSRSYEMISK